MSQPLLRPEQVAQQLGVSVKTIRRLVDRGELEAFKVAGRLRIDPASVQRYLDTHRAGDAAPPTSSRPKRSRRGRLTQILDP